MRWEYKTVKLGRQEWELVAAFDTNQGTGETRDIVIIFKKPRL